MPSLTLQSPSDLARTGSDQAWSSVGDVILTGPYASSGAYSPGDVSDFIILNIAAPGLSSLPTQLFFSLAGHEISSGTGPLWVVDDTVGLGLATGGILTANAAQNLPFGTSQQLRVWTIPTSGITLAQLNAGSVYLYLGFTAVPTSEAPFNAGNWAISYSETGSQNLNGVYSGWSGSGPFYLSTGNQTAAATSGESGTIQAIATWVGMGAAPAYVPLLVNSPVSASGFSVAPGSGGVGTWTASVTDAFGNTASSSGATSQSVSLSNSQKETVTVHSGAGTFSGMVSALSTSPAGYGKGEVGAYSSVNMTASVTTPDPASLYIHAAALAYAAGSATSVPFYQPKLHILPPMGKRVA